MNPVAVGHVALPLMGAVGSGTGTGGSIVLFVTITTGVTGVGGWLVLTQLSVNCVSEATAGVVGPAGEALQVLVAPVPQAHTVGSETEPGGTHDGALM